MTENRTKKNSNIMNRLVSVLSEEDIKSNIQTQQDVDNFNQTYNVNLVLPQEG